MPTEVLDPWLRDHLVCPLDYQELVISEDSNLICSSGHLYPIIDNIPVMLTKDKISTQPKITRMVMDKLAETTKVSHLNSVSKKEGTEGDSVDPFVQKSISEVCGIMYDCLINKLRRYPLPDLPLPGGKGKIFLDLGCNWGRWCVSASRLGYQPIGIDHNLEAIRAARRVACKLNAAAVYLVADARSLPFRKESFDVVFSYSVLQHFYKEDVRISLSGVSRVLKKGGVCLTQMPNAFGLRNLYHQAKKCFRSSQGFEVRYWTPGELSRVFTGLIGPVSLSVDGFFSLNAQESCSDLLPLYFRYIISCSLFLRRLSRVAPGLKYLADSLYVKSIRQ
ncbi:methyltransferase domain-containing protein [bacterium]|nr:MAG: methyltransferase domain-containing protein [bacterium]